MIEPISKEQLLEDHDHDGVSTKKILLENTKGTLPIDKGGTGQTTANTALNALLPSQTGNSGEFLTTNGTDVSWGAAAGKFGGTGADGALSVTSGTTTLDFAIAKLVVKNYTSINIASGATLAGSNPYTNGTVLILRSQGDVTIEGTIDLRDMGAIKATDAWGILDTSSHIASSILTGGLQYSSNFLYLYNDSNNIYRRFLVVTPGSGGSDGGGGTTNASAGGSGSLFGAGGDGRNTAGNGSNAGGAMAGGGGACNAGSGTGTTEGRSGGGALLIECGGALNFTGTINTSGKQPSGGSGIRNAAGGSSGGMCVVLYNSLTANSGTVNDAGGDGGDLEGGSLLGGDGGASTGGLILKNDWFA